MPPQIDTLIHPAPGQYCFGTTCPSVQSHTVFHPDKLV